jgi:FKBP-type peptidyl-prolyl cis-trans isomerase
MDRRHVNDNGWLTDGNMFGSGGALNEPFDFACGRGGLIQGWDKDELGMKMGSAQARHSGGRDGMHGGSGVITPDATRLFAMVRLAGSRGCDCLGKRPGVPSLSSACRPNYFRVAM